jgi:serine/threonine-protein kinase
VADALDYAHREQIVHRDIKPGNLIYNPEQDRVKVTDFGIARTAGSSRTRTGALVGSPSYMAPEQLTGDTVDGRADIFSLGVTLYQLTTGQLPFEGENLAGLAYQITKVRHEDVRSVRPDLPPALSRVVNRALRKKPDSRFATAAEMAEALRRIARRLGEDPMAQTVGQGTMQ